jgi:hypothetical protein
MIVQTEHPSLQLAHREMIRLAARTPVRVDCDDGTLWITEDGDPRDIVLQAGESWTGGCRATVLIHALQPSLVRLADAGRPC